MQLKKKKSTFFGDVFSHLNIDSLSFSKNLSKYLQPLFLFLKDFKTLNSLIYLNFILLCCKIRGSKTILFPFQLLVWNKPVFPLNDQYCLIHYILNFIPVVPFYGKGNGTPLQYSCLENPMDGGAWCAAVHGVAKSQTRFSDFTFTFHFHALEKEMETYSSILAWRIPGTGEPGGLPSMGSHRVGHD